MIWVGWAVCAVASVACWAGALVRQAHHYRTTPLLSPHLDLNAGRGLLVAGWVFNGCMWMFWVLGAAQA